MSSPFLTAMAAVHVQQVVHIPVESASPRPSQKPHLGSTGMTPDPPTPQAIQPVHPPQGPFMLPVPCHKISEQDQVQSSCQPELSSPNRDWWSNPCHPPATHRQVSTAATSFSAPLLHAPVSDVTSVPCQPAEEKNYSLLRRKLKVCYDAPLPAQSLKEKVFSFFPVFFPSGDPPQASGENKPTLDPAPSVRGFAEKDGGFPKDLSPPFGASQKLLKKPRPHEKSPISGPPPQKKVGLPKE